MDMMGMFEKQMEETRKMLNDAVSKMSPEDQAKANERADIAREQIEMTLKKVNKAKNEYQKNNG